MSAVAAPTADEKVPSGHGVQVEDCDVVLYVPAGHVVQVVEPGWGLKVPGGQSVQTADVVAAGTVDLVPAGHLEHVDVAVEEA